MMENEGSVRAAHASDLSATTRQGGGAWVWLQTNKQNRENEIKTYKSFHEAIEGEDPHGTAETIEFRIGNREYKLKKESQFKDTSCAAGTKTGRQRALQLFPSAHALLARKKDHGRAEAALIALAGVRQ